jgi:hypothetical protein
VCWWLLKASVPHSNNYLILTDIYLMDDTHVPVVQRCTWVQGPPHHLLLCVCSV